MTSAMTSALAYFHEQEWIADAAAVLAGLDREHQPKPDDTRVRPGRSSLDGDVRVLPDVTALCRAASFRQSRFDGFAC